MRLHWINELEIDTLEFKGHWASKDQGAIYRLENVQDSRNVWLWFSFPHWHKNAGVGWLHRPHSPSLAWNQLVITFWSQGMAASRTNLGSWCDRVIRSPDSLPTSSGDSQLKKLSSNVQGKISEDQKNSSVVARVYYQNQRSREVATKANQYLEPRHGEKGSALIMEVRSRLSDKSASSPEQEENDDGSAPEEHNIFITPIHFKSKNASKTPGYFTGRKILLFTPEEDKYLRMELGRQDFGNWTAILRDSDIHCQKGRKFKMY